MNQQFLVGFGEGIGEDNFMIIKGDMENLASFLTIYSDCPEIKVETLQDYPLLTSRYGMINRCYDQDFMQEFLPVLAPYITGEREPGEIETLQSMKLVGLLIPVPDWDCANGHGNFNLDIKKPGELLIVPDELDASLDEGEELEL